LNVGKIFAKVAKVQRISEVFPYNKAKGKVYIPPSNYHPIDNVPPKLSKCPYIFLNKTKIPL
jgi:hypothetical protein